MIKNTKQRIKLSIMKLLYENSHLDIDIGVDRDNVWTVISRQKDEISYLKKEVEQLWKTKTDKRIKKKAKT